jgi:spermidine synthase
MTNLRRLVFLLFFVSGFCGLVYEVIWLRLAFASFGVITPVVSVVVSVFMSGLALGSWLGGRAIGRLCQKSGLSPIVFYGASELVIGASSLAVPWLYRAGDRLLAGLGQSNSAAYLAASAAVIALSVLPWTLFMGTTFPWMMAFLRERFGDERSFSYLYLANVVGA